MLHRRGQNFPMRFKHRSRSSWRNIGVLDALPGIHQVRPHRREIPSHLNIHCAVFAARWIKHVYRPELLIHNRVRPRRCRFNVHAIAGQRFSHLLAAGVIHIQTHRAIAVRQKINFVAHPHRRRIVRILSLHLFYAGVGKFCDPDR